MSGFNQRAILLVLSFAAFLAGIAGSLQAPFYPKEAENKGVNEAQVGIVFALYHFTIFTTSPFFGRNVTKLGAKRMVNFGLFIMGISAIGFGLMERVKDNRTFLGMCLVIRVIEAFGHSSFKTATFSIVSKEFPETVTFSLAALQSSFGTGLTLGPFIGGLFYDVGGFVLPFMMIGILIIFAAIMTYLVLPSNTLTFYNQDMSSDDLLNNRKGLRDIIKSRVIVLQAISTLSATICIGFLQATLRNHINQFHLSDAIVGKKILYLQFSGSLRLRLNRGNLIYNNI